MKPPDADELVQKFAILLNCDSELLPQNSDNKLSVSVNGQDRVEVSARQTLLGNF